MKKLELILNPTLKDFSKISAFINGPILRDGYYGFISDNIFMIRCERDIVGYLTYSRSEVCVTLDGIFVAPKVRRQGIATFLVEQALEYFKARGVCVAELKAVTEEGQAHARSLKFKKIELGYDYTLYMKILCPYRKQCKKAKKMLAVWKKDYWNTTPDKEPDMSWSLIDNKLPIIFRCKPSEWTAAIIVNGEIVKQELINNLFMVHSRYARFETNGTYVRPWSPECMRGTVYYHR